MIGIKILLCAAFLTAMGIGSAEASPKAPAVSSNTHAELQIGTKIVTLSKSQEKSKKILICSIIRGVSYGSALVGLQSLAVSLPAMATVAGAPVAAISAGVGAISAGIGIAFMIANDKLCIGEGFTR